MLLYILNSPPLRTNDRCCEHNQATTLKIGNLPTFVLNSQDTHIILYVDTV